MRADNALAAAVAAYRTVAVRDTVKTPKRDEDYVQAAVDAYLDALQELDLFGAEAEAPQRVQLSRKKGWRMPPNTVSIARPHFFGNPFVIGTSANGGNITREQAVSEFRRALVEGRLQFTVAMVRKQLAGKNLACFCRLDEACHGDVLLAVANGGARG